MKTKELMQKTGAKFEQIAYLRRRGILKVTNAGSVISAGHYYDYAPESVEILKERLGNKNDPVRR